MSGESSLLHPLAPTQPAAPAGGTHAQALATSYACNKEKHRHARLLKRKHTRILTLVHIVIYPFICAVCVRRDWAKPHQECSGQIAFFRVPGLSSVTLFKYLGVNMESYGIANIWARTNHQKNQCCTHLYPILT
jgi:hypothetical protein